MKGTMTSGSNNASVGNSGTLGVEDDEDEGDEVDADDDVVDVAEGEDDCVGDNPSVAVTDPLMSLCAIGLELSAPTG